MALWEAIKSAARGNLSDATGYLFVSQDEVDRGRRLDSELEALRRQEYERGIITAQQYQETVNRIESQAFKPGGIFSQEGTDVAGGLAEGAKEGLFTMQAAVRETTRSTIKFGLNLIPWQGWVIIVGYIAWRFGWLQKLIKR